MKPTLNYDSSMTLFTIVTICFNDLKALIKTIDSVEKIARDVTKGFNIQHIVVDGDSNDGTLQYLESIDYDWFSWTSEPDDGISDAFNKGVSSSKGDYVMILNAGDLLSSYLNMLNDVFSLKPEVVFFPVKIQGKKKYKVIKPNTHKLKRKVSVFHCGMIVRNDIYGYVGMYNKRFTLAMDYEWICRAIYLGVALSSESNDILSIMNTDGISNQQIFKAKSEVFMIQKKYIGFSFALLEYVRSFVFGIGRVIYEKIVKDSYIR